MFPGAGFRRSSSLRLSPPYTESEILESEKVHFKVRKMPFSPPRKWPPKVNEWSKNIRKVHLNAPKQHFSDYSIDFGGHFLGGGRKWHFSDVELHFLRNPPKGAFARGALRRFVANCAPNLRKIAGIWFSASEEGRAKSKGNLSRI